VREEHYAIDQWQADARSGKLRESFACGTAAVLTPIGAVRGTSVDFTIGNGGPGLLTEQLRSQLVAIQRMQSPDPHNWVHRLF
jgi:branched-chain amino acid aminotransferase